jgi:hypothetical protein
LSITTIANIIVAARSRPPIPLSFKVKHCHHIEPALALAHKRDGNHADLPKLSGAKPAQSTGDATRCSWR